MKKVLRNAISIASTQNVFNYKLNLELNKKDFPLIKYKEKEVMDKFNIIEDSFVPEMVDILFDVNEDIIIVSPNEYRYLNRNEFGKLDILTNRKLDISNCEIVNGYGLLKFRPKIKILVPKGVSLTFECPYKHNYIFKIYDDNSVTTRYSINKNIPDYYLYTDLNFSLYVDLVRLRKLKKVMTIDFGTPIITMNFQHMYFIGSNEYTNINNVYWIRNDEFIKNFESTY